MSIIRKVYDWTVSSVSDDRQELEIYQTFRDEIDNIKNVRQKYLDEEGREDISLYTEFRGRLIPLSLLATYKTSVMHDKSMDVIERAKVATILEDKYRERLKELESRIISMAIKSPDNVYLKQISSSINIINTLIKRYAHLIAIKRSELRNINNANELKLLEDNILIRISEIESRLANDTMKR